MVTGTQAYLTIRNRLSQAGIEDAGFEAETLLRHVCGKTRFELDTVPDAEWETLQALLARREEHEPLQYLLGSWEFLGITLQVGPGVLIPRPETEEVCLAAVEAVSRVTAPVVLDLCAGTGALGLGVLSCIPAAQVQSVELDAAAFEYLQKNTCGQQGVQAVQADVLDYASALPECSVDLIVCNPPYVTHKEYEDLEPELRHEPQKALVPPASFGGVPLPDDGLFFYRQVAQRYFRVLKNGGVLVFEIGSAQGKAVESILHGCGYTGVCLRSDMAGHSRIAIGKRVLP